MKFLKSLGVFASVASAVSVDLSKRDSPLDVKIQMVDNSIVEATITNTGTETLRLFKTGTILDSAAVEKTEVFSGADRIPFDGLRMRISTANLDDSAFEPLAAGETITKTWDIAEVHDLSAGGPISVASSGFIPYAVGNSTTISDTPVSFSSNTLTTTVDGAAAAIVRRNFHALTQRQIVQSDCTGTKLTATRTALTQCAQLASAASQAAASGDAAKMTEYFKSSSSSTRSTVAGIFSKIASECGASPNGGVSKLYCSDVYRSCSSGVLAYTLPSQTYMVNCPLYYSALTPLSQTCHDQDQATTTLHETTHLTQIAGTTDQGGCYGYSCTRSLTASQNLRHADTYALFANAIYVGC
ncbi:Deuterolysin metalloprotease family-domain-containing protein [Coniochaeta sp. 2T2.1]|nr:Deuterolysin metalloprotease family-domain-containing protein [Coniochaeta sp. 2T2.1]